MRNRCIRAGAVLAAAAGLAGCGSSGSGPRSPSASAIPLPGGVRVATDLRRCDVGANAFCGRELTLTWSSAHDRGGAMALAAAEGAALSRAGWSSNGGEAVGERSAQSPDGRLWLTYGPVSDDLQALAKGNIFRAPQFVRILRRDRAAHVPALSVLLEAGRS